MYDIRRTHSTYLKGIQDFLIFAENNRVNNGDARIYCKNFVRLKDIKDIEYHLITRVLTFTDNENRDSYINDDCGTSNEMSNSVEDTFGFNDQENLQTVLEDSQKPLYASCTKFFVLSGVLKLFGVKAKMDGCKFRRPIKASQVYQFGVGQIQTRVWRCCFAAHLAAKKVAAAVADSWVSTRTVAGAYNMAVVWYDTTRTVLGHETWWQRGTLISRVDTLRGRGLINYERMTYKGYFMRMAYRGPKLDERWRGRKDGGKVKSWLLPF
ncbi:hypothetical protein Tco_0977523 [Tanacetum coccineum]|uniref:Uncharacterized protein n=1 Tax=Tanacetum coccineum TaxID=301880 RepID=A0ABQ5EKB3_9ASTR